MRTRPVAEDNLRLAQQMATTSAAEDPHAPSGSSRHASETPHHDGSSTRKFTHSELLDAIAKNGGDSEPAPVAAGEERGDKSEPPESDAPESFPKRNSDHTMQLSGADLEEVIPKPAPTPGTETRNAAGSTRAEVAPGPSARGPADRPLEVSEREVRGLYRFTMEPMLITLERLLLDGQVKSALAVVRALKKTL